MTELPDPFTPANCDLRDFPFMPLDVVRLRDSDIAALSTGDEFRCAVLLWCVSWHQVPAGSLPDDDVVLSQLAGFGRVVKEWKKVRAGALRGWVMCSDGRLYHPVVTVKALDAWNAKLEQRWRTECARIKKHNDRHETNLSKPSFEEWLSLNCPQGQQLPVPRDNAKSPALVPSETPSKREGEGQGQGDLNTSVPIGTGADAPQVAKSAAELTKAELWSAGKSLLKQAGMAEAQCGTFVGKLVKDYGDDIVIEAVRVTVVEQPADPASYLKACCQQRKGQRPNRQESLEQKNRAVAAALAGEAA